MNNQKNIGRLQQILDQIHDPDIKDIVKRIIEVEISYRSAERVNFPRQKVRDVIDGAARVIEAKNNKEDEVSKN